MELSLRARPERSWSIASRVVTAERYAFGESNLRLVLEQRALVANKGLLDDVLGLGDAAQHPVGDREQQRAQILVRLGHTHPKGSPGSAA